MRNYLLSLLTLLFCVTSIYAQSITEQLPIDPAIRVGVLENGMTYFIRHNEKPKNQASFYIYHDVGAIQEDDNQQGLAHFLEHMAFNGTKNFPGKSMIEQLESIGVMFGYNLNAATSWDYTEYMIKDMPVTEENLDLALLILHDWSQFIALQPEEIDSERGVIMEELRTRDGGQYRSMLNLLQQVLRGSLYERRNLIGHLEGLKSFDHTALEAFYKKWYRPEYQYLVIVGDVDVDQVEAKIKSVMADIPASSADAAQKEVITVPTTDEPIISIFSDEELTQSSVMMYARREAMPKEFNNTIEGLTRFYINSMAANMMNYRLYDISQQDDAPFVSCGMGDGQFIICPTLEVTHFDATAHEGRTKEAFRAMYTEMERMRRYGFTSGEFERAKQRMNRWFEREYNNRNDRSNLEHAERCLEFIKSGSPIMDDKAKWELDQMIINNLTLEQLNAAYRQTAKPNENLVILVHAPKKEGAEIASEADIRAIIAEVESSDIAPYVDCSVSEPLISSELKLKGSKVKSIAHNDSLGFTEWTLKNGIKVVVRPSTLKADEVSINATSKGGKSMLGVEESLQATFYATVMQAMGVGQFSQADLSKLLTGKNIFTYMTVGNYDHTFHAQGSPKDIETILQMLYLSFTSPRFDLTDLDNIKKAYVPYFQNQLSNPSYIMGRANIKTLYQNNPRRDVTLAEHIESLTIERLADIHSKLYAYADDFTFFINGNIDLDSLKPLVEKYIGSLPTSKRVEYKAVDDGVRMATGSVTNDFRTPMQQPKVSVSLYYTGDITNDAKNRLTLNLLTRALNSRYLKSIREEKGGTYGVSVSGDITKNPTESYSLHIGFDTNEQLADELIEICDLELRRIAKEGPLAEDIAKSKEFLEKEYYNLLETNMGWMYAMIAWYEESYNYKDEYLGILESITEDDIKALAQKILDDGNRTLVIMRPE